MEIEYLLRCEPEPDPYVGNCMASGDDAVDRETEQWIADQLDAGNEWAWCCVFVTARVELAGETFEGVASMGGCSYKSESDFRDDQYFADLKSEARDQLLEALREAGDRGDNARKALAGIYAEMNAAALKAKS